MGLPDSKIIEEMDRLRQNKISFERKGDMVMKRFNKLLNIHK